LSFGLSSLRLSGGVKVIVEYANRLAQRGHTLFLVTPGETVDRKAFPVLERNVTVVESPVPLKPKQSLPANLRLSLSLSRAIPPCDLVISTHTPTTVPAWLGARWRRQAKLFWLYLDYTEMFEQRPLELLLLKWAARWHDKVLYISEFCRQENLRMSGVDGTVVGVGLSDAYLFRPLPEDQRPQTGQQTILYLGDDRPRKGLADFLAACQYLYPQNRHIKIELVSKYDFKIQEQLPIHFYLRPNQQKLAYLYATCDVFVSTSWREGFGLPPLEAMACGAPVVLTDSSGVREFARNGENCLMVPPRNPKTLAEAIQCILTDRNLAEKLRENGPPTAAKFDWDEATDRFEAAIYAN
jgi:glycosyltransferase involved in cell wall biosynthesis